ncbi:MAG: hypothetical protein WBL63_00995 [Candidatus Acidiferrum sp.]
MASSHAVTDANPIRLKRLRAAFASSHTGSETQACTLNVYTVTLRNAAEIGRLRCLNFKHLKAAVLSFGLAMPLLFGPLSAVQQKKPAHPAPIPAQILAAKKVFVANGGGDESRYEEASFSGGPDRA